QGSPMARSLFSPVIIAFHAESRRLSYNGQHCFASCDEIEDLPQRHKEKGLHTKQSLRSGAPLKIRVRDDLQSEEAVWVSSYPRKRVSRLIRCGTNLDSRVRGNDGRRGEPCQGEFPFPSSVGERKLMKHSVVKSFLFFFGCGAAALCS